MGVASLIAAAAVAAVDGAEEKDDVDEEGCGFETEGGCGGAAARVARTTVRARPWNESAAVADEEDDEEEDDDDVAAAVACSEASVTKWAVSVPPAARIQGCESVSIAEIRRVASTHNRPRRSVCKSALKESHPTPGPNTTRPARLTRTVWPVRIDTMQIPSDHKSALNGS